jgi:thymidylate synthase
MSMWDVLYRRVLDGDESSPRDRRTLEVRDVRYQMEWDDHFDAREGRGISLQYIQREVLWFCIGERYDTRMVKHAKLWESCVGPDGGINSNYGQYLFGPGDGFNVPFFNALDHIVEDRDSRRAWVAIFQEFHQSSQWGPHPEIPCTTGIGFRLTKYDELEMTVHMRSQDLWHGAANDEAVCYLLQLMAVAYLAERIGEDIGAGTITHYVDSLHLYERHWEKARAALYTPDREEVLEMTRLTAEGFTPADLRILRRVPYVGDEPSELLHVIMDIPGDFGMDSDCWCWSQGGDCDG